MKVSHAAHIRYDMITTKVGRIIIRRYLKKILVLLIKKKQIALQKASQQQQQSRFTFLNGSLHQIGRLLILPMLKHGNLSHS